MEVGGSMYDKWANGPLYWEKAQVQIRLQNHMIKKKYIVGGRGRGGVPASSPPLPQYISGYATNPLDHPGVYFETGISNNFLVICYSSLLYGACLAKILAINFGRHEKKWFLSRFICDWEHADFSQK